MKAPIDIEDLLHWAWKVQAVEAALGGRSMEGPGRVRSSAGLVYDYGQLGLRLGGGGGAIAADLHPDAETAYQAVCRLPDNQRNLVAECARAGLRPDWMPGAKPRPVMVERRRGKPAIVYKDQIRRKYPLYCLLRYDPDPDLIAYRRQQYSLWRAGLVTLADALQSLRLERYQVTGPKAPLAPWR